MNPLFFTIISLLFSSQALAVVTCAGTVENVYKWHNVDQISARIKLNSGGFTNWIKMPTQSDESMILMAFAAQKPVTFYFSNTNTTECIEGWTHNTPLEGYFIVGH